MCVCVCVCVCVHAGWYPSHRLQGVCGVPISWGAPSASCAALVLGTKWGDEARVKIRKHGVGQRLSGGVTRGVTWEAISRKFVEEWQLLCTTIVLLAFLGLIVCD